MPRAGRFSRWDVEERPEALQDDPVLIETLVQKAGIADPAERESSQRELTWTIRHYRAIVLADKQERPARIVAALKPGPKLAGDLLAWFKSLPPGLRLELRAGELEGSLEALIPKTNDRLAHWQGQVKAHRPSGEGAASLDLRRSLIDIIAKYSLADERTQRNWVAFACRKIGAKYPDEKKNRRRFTGVGEHKPKPSRRWEKHIRVRQSEAERRLKDVPI
jgi:hypothetical protein